MVVGAGLILYAGWSLTARPYPNGRECGAPAAVVLDSPVEIPEAIEVGRTGPDYGEILRRLEDGEHVSEDDPRLQTSWTETVNHSEIWAAESDREAQLACQDGLRTVGFWWRGLGPIAVVGAALLIARFVLRGGPTEEETGESPPGLLGFPGSACHVAGAG